MRPGGAYPGALLLLLAAARLFADSPKRTPADSIDDKHDLQGIWEVRDAPGNLEAHSADAGIRAGESVIIDPPDGKIPYQPAAAATQKENYKNRLTADPVAKCYLPGVPRITYMPYPFQIFQTDDFVAITYEYVSRLPHHSYEPAATSAGY